MRYNTVYFVSANSYLFEKIFLCELKKNILKNKTETSLGVETYYYNEIDLSQLLESLATSSLFSDYKIVVLKNADKLSDKDKNTIKKYCETSNKLCPLVIYISNDIENELKKDFGSLAKFVNLESNSTQLLKQYIMSILKETGKKITVDALNLFLEYNSNHIDSAEGELEKLIGYSGDKNTITLDDVNAVCSNNADKNIFKLVDSLSAKNKNEVFSLARNFLEKEQYPGYILSILSSHLLKIYRIKRLLELGYRKTEIQTKLDILSSRYYNNLLSQATYFESEELGRKIKFLLETDRCTKTSKAEDCDIVEMALAKLCL